MNPRNAWFVAGFLAGCAVAAAIGLLYAPASGGRTRQAIRDHFSRATREAREAGMRAEADILTRYNTARNSATLGEPGAPPLAPAVPAAR
jgi:gas vesicle protein